MTANELAIDLELQSSQMEYGYAVSDWKLLSDSATMLRQQQAEIDRLKSLCISYIDEEWLGTSSYQNKIDEVNNDCKKINR